MLEHNCMDDTIAIDRAEMLREKQGVTAPLAKSVDFVQAHFPKVVEKGRKTAERMSAVLLGHKVKRTYFYQDTQDGGGRLPMVIEIAKIQSEDGGIIRVYDSTGTVRELPALLFDFWFRPNAVICNGPDFTLLFEVMA